MNFAYKIIGLLFRLWNGELELGCGVKIDPRAFIARGGRVSIGDQSVLRAGAMLLPSRGSITIGKRSSINQYVVINGQGGVRIGDSVMIAAFVSMFAANHVFDDPSLPMLEQGLSSKGGIRIEDDVWIGTHAVILDGVTIGTGSVIGAGAVVTKDVPPFSIVTGVPGQVVRKRTQDRRVPGPGTPAFATLQP